MFLVTSLLKKKKKNRMASNTEIIIALLLIQNLSCCEEAEQKDGEMCYSVHAVKSLCSFWKKSVGDPAAALVQFDFSRFLGESGWLWLCSMSCFCSMGLQKEFTELF